MKKQMILAASLVLIPYLAIAANESVSTEKSTAQDKGTGTTGVSKSDRDGKTMTSMDQKNSQSKDADNTGVNKRDRDDKTLTPMDQKNNQSDLNITQDIRQALMKDEFSTDAKNIKVITRDGKVTLRGPVSSAAEREKINTLVKAMPGIKSFDNQLQVK